MSIILQETKKRTFLETLATDYPEMSEEFKPLFTEKIELYMPEIILERIVSDFSEELHKKISVSDIAHCDYLKKNNVLLNLDALLELYYERWILKKKKKKDSIFEEFENADGVRSMPSYMASYEEIPSKSKETGPFSAYLGIINRDALYANGRLGLQKLEAIVDFRDKKNPSRFTQFTINEISREKEDPTVGHFLVSLKNSISDRLGHHVWLFPNRKRYQFLGLPGKLRDYINSAQENIPPLFEWVEQCCDKEEHCSLDDIGMHPEIVNDNTTLIHDILQRKEAAQYALTIEEIRERIATIYVPKDILREIESYHIRDLHSKQLIVNNKDLFEKSRGLICELNVDVLRSLNKKAYAGRENNIRYSKEGTLRFSELYYVGHSPCKDEMKSEYSVFQIYVHRPSTIIEQEKFEVYLEVANTKNNLNSFVLKIEELERRQEIGTYAVELLTLGNKVEHHIQVLNSSHDLAINLPRKIRELLKENGYFSAPEYKHIYDYLKIN